MLLAENIRLKKKDNKEPYVKKFLDIDKADIENTVTDAPWVTWKHTAGQW